MQKNIAKNLAVGSLLLVVGVVSFGSMASAKSIHATTRVRSTVNNAHMVSRALGGYRHILPGKAVSAVTGTTLVMTSGDKTYTIDVSGITPMDRKGATIALTDILAGHSVSVRGTVTGTTVTSILSLRDVTLPVRTTTGMSTQ